MLTFILFSWIPVGILTLAYILWYDRDVINQQFTNEEVLIVICLGYIVLLAAICKTYGDFRVKTFKNPFNKKEN